MNFDAVIVLLNFTSKFLLLLFRNTNNFIIWPCILWLYKKTLISSSSFMLFSEGFLYTLLKHLKIETTSLFFFSIFIMPFLPFYFIFTSFIFSSFSFSCIFLAKTSNIMLNEICKSGHLTVDISPHSSS